MPVYVYRCTDERHLQCPDTEQVFSMHQIPAQVDCPSCGAAARRVFTVPHLITNPHHLRDENRLRKLGQSEKDYLAEQKADDAAYWARHERIGTGEGLKSTSLDQILQEQSV